MSVTIKIENDQRDSEFELNVANTNFAMLWLSLDLPLGEYLDGKIDGRFVLESLKGFDVEFLLRDTVVCGGTTYCGVVQEQAQRYITTLTKIAEEAIKREELIIYG